jgi:hypothetical protein
VGLERGPLSLVRITEVLLEWKSSGSGSRNQENIDLYIHSPKRLHGVMLN